MRMLRRAVGALALAMSAAPALAADVAQGTIETDEGRAEVLAGKMPVGKRIELPEGWYMVEEEGTEDGEVGSFTIMPRVAAAPDPEGARPSAPPRPVASAPAGILPEDPSMAGACRPERNAYLRQLWKESGIEQDDPEALIAGLDAGGSGPATGFYWFALQVDPFRNLAWSSDLRSRADALVRCMRQPRAAAR